MVELRAARLLCGPRPVNGEAGSCHFWLEPLPLATLPSSSVIVFALSGRQRAPGRACGVLHEARFIGEEPGQRLGEGGGQRARASDGMENKEA